MTFESDSSAVTSEYEIVVFERLELEDGTVVATHEDINDADQTVKITPNPKEEEKPKEPFIKTTVKFEDGNKTAKPDKSTTIVDEVVYGNLTVGTEYVLSGKLVSRKTGKTIAVNGKAVESKETFTPSKTDGRVDVRFTFDAAGFEGMTYNAFETAADTGKNF